MSIKNQFKRGILKAREIKDGRKIPRDAFLEQYFTARENVNSLKRNLAPPLRLIFVVKNIDGTDFSYRENIDVIDRYIPEKYTKEELEKLIIL